MIADTLDNCRRTAVPDCEPLACFAGREERATGRSIEARVAGDDLRRIERRGARRHDRDLAPGHALADIVIRLTLENQPHPTDRECAEALASASGELGSDRARCKRVQPVRQRDLAGNPGADGAVLGCDRLVNVDRLPFGYGRTDDGQNLLIKRGRLRIEIDRLAPLIFRSGRGDQGTDIEQTSAAFHLACSDAGPIGR